MLSASSPKGSFEKSARPCDKGVSSLVIGGILLGTAHEDLGKNLRKWMKIRGVNNLQLAEILGVPPPQVSTYTTGKVHPNGEQLDRIAKALDIPRQYLVYDSSHPKSGNAEYEFIAKTELPDKDGGAMVLFEVLGAIEQGAVTSPAQMRDLLRSKLHWPSQEALASGSGGNPPKKKRPYKRKKKIPNP